MLTDRNNTTIHIDDLKTKLNIAHNAGYSTLIRINGEYYNIDFKGESKIKKADLTKGAI